MKKSKRDKMYKQKCLFCGNGKISVDHIKWLHEQLDAAVIELSGLEQGLFDYTKREVNKMKSNIAIRINRINDAFSPITKG